MNIITLQEFQAKLATSKGAKIVTITTITIPELLKNCPYKDVFKVQWVNGIVNFNYSNSVNRQREREGKITDFKPEKRKWGTRLNDSPFISYVNKEGIHNLYLEIKVEHIVCTEYKIPSGEVIPLATVEPYLKKSKSNKEHQGVEKEIKILDFNVKNIISISINGIEYLIKKD